MQKICLIFFLLAGLNLLGQYTSTSRKAIKFFEEGRRNYQLLEYTDAENNLKKAINSDESFIEAYMVLAKLFWDLNRLDEAIDAYSKGLKINPSFYAHGYLYKGTLEHSTGRYKEARESFLKLLELERKDSKLINRASFGLKHAEFAIKAVENPVEFNPIQLGSTINSVDDEYWPSLSADEKILVFTRLVKSDINYGYQEDFYISQFVDSAWTVAKEAGWPLNTPDNEGAQSISANGKLMVYTVCNRPGVIGRCDLYFSEKIGDQWKEPANMGPIINSRAKETQPALSSDGRELFFSSNRAGGKGGLDIWLTRKNENGQWSKPVNLGDSINTTGNEISPFIHHDGKTLYFASDRHLGLGGSDIFFSKFKGNDQWSKAINLGYPINTHRNEIGLIINAKGNKAYYSSDIDTSYGRDIFYFELYEEARPQEASFMKGNVFNSFNKKPLSADFELYDLSNGELVYKSNSDPRHGDFLVCLPTNRNYMLNVSKKGYLFYSENFNFSGIHHINNPFYKDIPLRPVTVGQSVILKNIFYETDEYELKPESKYELDKLVKFLETNSKIKIEISGHTDNIGSSQYNQILSGKRAGSVVEYLVSRGIEKTRLQSKGYGPSHPIDSNDTEQGRANNRRTELTIIE